MSLAADANPSGAFEGWDTPSADILARMIESHALNLDIGRSLHPIVIGDRGGRAADVLIAEEIPFLLPSLATQISLLKGRNATLEGKKSFWKTSAMNAVARNIRDLEAIILQLKGALPSL
jgi:hypothetical protein